jgi:hypothetical protein
VQSVLTAPSLTTITINGSNFVQTGLVTEVRLDGYAQPLTLTSTGNTQIQAQLPAESSPGRTWSRFN